MARRRIMNFSRMLCMAIIVSMVGVVSSAAQRSCSFGKGVVSLLKDTAPQLRYRLIDRFGPLRFCDFDCAGPCGPSSGQKHAEELFPKIREDAEAFRAIVRRLGLEKTHDLSREQQIAVYFEYEKLVCGMTLDRQGDAYRFKLLAANGLRVEGRIKQNGEVTILEQEP